MFYLTTHSIHFIYGYMVSENYWRDDMKIMKRVCELCYYPSEFYKNNHAIIR